jgi:hypothetical protein
MDVTTAIYSSMALGVVLVIWLTWNEPLMVQYREAVIAVVAMGAAGLFGGYTAGLAGALVGVVGAGLLLAAWRSTVNRSAQAAADYGTHDEEEDAARGVVSLGGKAETAKSAETETPRNAPSPVDINALRHEARAAALGALLAHGLIVPGKRTAAMRAVFGDITGDAYTRAGNAVKRHEQQVLATLPPAEEVEPEAPRLIPISDGKGGYIEA